MLQAKVVGKKSDIWSFGALILEIVTQKPPWEGLKNMDIIEKLSVGGNHPPIPSTHPILQKILEVCLSVSFCNYFRDVSSNYQPTEFTLMKF